MSLTKMVHISNPDTIKKLESLETALDLKSPKIVDKALDVYIIEVLKQRDQQSIIDTFILLYT